LTSASKTASIQPSSGTPTPATISVSPGSVNFGSVVVGSNATQSVTISNGGGSSLTVTQVSTTTSGLSITGISFPLNIGPGKQSNFSIEFSPRAGGSLSGDVSVLSNASSSPKTVSVSGTAIAATLLLTLNASSLSFGNVSVGNEKALSVNLTNTGNSKVTISSVGVSSSSYSASGVSPGLTLTPGQVATLDLTFSPQASATLTGTVTVASDATDSPATISLSGTGVQAASHSVALQWTASTSAVTGYNVYRSGVSGGPYSKLNSSEDSATSYTDNNVRAAQTYYYVVTSESLQNTESAYSNQVSATIP
jgi:hypothetical protein